MNPFDFFMKEGSKFVCQGFLRLMRRESTLLTTIEDLTKCMP